MPPPKPRSVDPEQAVRDALKRVSEAGDDFEDVLSQAERDVADVFVRRHNELAPALEALKTAEGRLVETVESHPQLFVKPRSRSAAGVKAERRKNADKWELDPEATAELIREHMPALASAISKKTVIDTKKLGSLTPAQLKKLGVKRTVGAEKTTIKRLRDDLGERRARLEPWLS